MAALKELGPKVASQNRLALDADQERLYDSLMLIAENNGNAYASNDARRAVEEAYADYRKATSEQLRSDFRAVKSLLTKDLQKVWNETHKTASADVDAALWQFEMNEGKAEMIRSIRTNLDYFKADLVALISDSSSPSEGRALERALAPMSARDLEQMARKVAHKTAAKHEFGLYGYRAKTATLGLTACAEIRAFAGQTAYDLHSRRATMYDKLTGFLREHSKKSRCRYSKLLLSSYPDRPDDLVIASDEEKAEDEKQDKTASMPSSVDDWLTWEG
jgi:hypothetical protein